jgi:predicted dehydrogenase
MGESGLQRRASEAVANLCVAVVGYGSIGRRHCENLAKLGVHRRFVVRRRESPNPAFLPPEDVIVVHSIRESIASGIDLAVVCNPTSLHVATAREFVAAGIPVLIEKPLAAHFSEADLFVREVNDSGARAGMLYCMRYHPAYALARNYVSQGRLGRIVRAKVWFESYLPDWHPWEDYRESYAARSELGGGVLPTLDHEIDFINWCFGPLAECSGMTTRSGKLDIDVNDTAQLTMHYADHEVEVQLSFAQPARRRGFEFVGCEGTLRFSFEEQRLELADGANATLLCHEPDFDLDLMYLALLRGALEAIAEGRPMPIPLDAGLDALRVASYLNHRNGL